MLKTALSPDRVRAAVAARVEVRRLEPLSSQGEVSQAFGVRTADGWYVVRVSANDEGYRKERYIAERFTLPGLVLPRIVDIWAADGHHFCLSRRLPGRDMGQFDSAAAGPLAEQVAAAHATIAAADVTGTSGYGHFGPDGRGAATSWREHLERELADAPWAGVDADMDVVDRLRDRLSVLIGYCPEARQLVHGDFGGNNLLAARGRLTGVIDWEQAMFGDPIFDVAWPRFWGPWVPSMRVHAQAQWSRWRGEQDAERRLRCYMVYIGLGTIRFFHLTGRPETAESLMRDCLATLLEP